MLTLLRHMDLRQYMPRSYVIAATDKMGAAKANSFEAAAAQTASSQSQVSLVVDYHRRLRPHPPALLEPGTPSDYCWNLCLASCERAI